MFLLSCDQKQNTGSEAKKLRKSVHTLLDNFFLSFKQRNERIFGEKKKSRIIRSTKTKRRHSYLPLTVCTVGTVLALSEENCYWGQCGSTQVVDVVVSVVDVGIGEERHGLLLLHLLHHAAVLTVVDSAELARSAQQLRSTRRRMF